MLMIKIKDGESIEKAIKRYKRKCEKIRLLKELRKIQFYVKPSIKKREAFLKAYYKQYLISKKENSA